MNELLLAVQSLRQRQVSVAPGLRPIAEHAEDPSTYLYRWDRFL